MYRKNHFHGLDSRWVYSYAAIGILLLAFGIRLIGLNKGIWLDEYYALKYSAREGLLGTVRGTMVNNQLPAYYILLKIWSIMGSQEPFLRLLSVFLNVGTVAVLMAWLKRYSYLAGILAGFFFAASINILRYSQEMRTYALILCATALSFYFASYVINRPAKLLGYVGLAVSLTVVTSAHLVGIMMVIPICVFILLIAAINQKQINFSKLIPTIAIPCLVFLAHYLAMREKLNTSTQNWWVSPVSLEVIWPMAKYVAGIPTLFRYLGTMREIFPNSTVLLGNIAQFLVLAFGITFIALGKWRRSYPFLSAALLYWLLMIGYSIFDKSIIHSRTILSGVIPLMGFAALHLATVRDRRVKLALIAGAIGLNLIFIGSWVTNTGDQPLEEWRQVSQVLESKWQEDDLVIFYPNYIEGTVRYYWPALPAEAGLAVRTRTNIEDFESEMRNRLAARVKSSKPQTVFFIVRVDASSLRDVKTYQKLLSALKSEFGESLVIHSSLVPYFDTLARDSITGPRDGISELLLAELESEFGQPVSFQEYGSSLWLTHDLGNSEQTQDSKATVLSGEE